MSGETQAHYDRLAGTYDANWSYSPDFIRWMSTHILRRLGLRPGDRVMDLGCGTGLFTTALAEQVAEVVCVDPSAEMLKHLPPDKGFSPIRASAEQIVSGEIPLPYERFDAILVKEAIHHVADPRTVLNGLADLLAPGGRILLVMLPTRISYPLFQAALDLFEQRQPDPAVMAAALQGAGLETGIGYESYPLTFDKAHYLGMVRARYMSLLSAFDDAALEEGITEIGERHPEDPLAFPDRFAFVLGRRS